VPGNISSSVFCRRVQINYGIFLDHFTANLLLDHFLTEKQFAGVLLPAVCC